jgi:hypothetical protein
MLLPFGAACEQGVKLGNSSTIYITHEDNHGDELVCVCVRLAGENELARCAALCRAAPRDTAFASAAEGWDTPV